MNAVSLPSRPNRRRRAPAACLAAACLAALWLAGPAVAAEPSPPRAAALKNLLVQDCGSCHGLTLKGGLGRPLLPAALADRSAAALADIILDGIPGTPMPPWRGLLSEAEARFLADLLKQGLAP
jgi:cytochrome c55X